MKRTFTMMLLLFGMIAAAKSTDPVAEGTKTTYHCHHKAAYYAIRADLEDGKLTIEQAQRKWQKALKELNKKEEAK